MPNGATCRMQPMQQLWRSARVVSWSSLEDAENKAAEIMQANGVDAAAISDDDITFEGAPEPYIINTVARHPALSPIVGQLVGWGVIDVGATASAACGAATSACGIWPVALSGSAWQEIQPEEGEACEERQIAIWYDDLPDKEYDEKTPQCWIEGKQQADLCDCYDCPDDSPADVNQRARVA